MSHPDAESAVGESAGCTLPLDSAAAGGEQRSSENGTAADTLQAGTDSAGCAAAATADTTPDGPQAPRTVREFEHALQGLGFTRRQAASIASGGFKAQAIEAGPDHDREALNDLRDALKRRAAILKD